MRELHEIGFYDECGQGFIHCYTTDPEHALERFTACLNAHTWVSWFVVDEYGRKLRGLESGPDSERMDQWQ